VVQATLSFTNGSGIPPAIPLGCGSTTFTVTGTAELAGLDANNVTPYSGPATFNGSGGSTICADAEQETGSLTVAIAGSGVGGTISCPSMRGGYNRVGIDIDVVLGGSCNLNGDVETFNFRVEGTTLPLQGNGVTTPITQATFRGAFVVQA
jgi:hypothetical protein